MIVDRAMCRREAAECIQLASLMADPAKKQILLQRAQEWVKLAYASNDEEFQKLLAQLNAAQMVPPQPRAVQQQQMGQTPKSPDRECG